MHLCKKKQYDQVQDVQFSLKGLHGICRIYKVPIA